ncbi:Coenzyme PQQ synthesis protein D (PqqD) [Georgenia satyanarayanai]|uniref:Coenzyme PQQ synthesis protein D (PqqD) n=1 Tax=Georgenia satyanarayanai TaxID=860221 RepID=A0A2Y9AC02_9MICO|nr:PqqD family protein [Georgenia satyanarayanai]PYG00690.1 coenzyme PQQ synthesis protein D (PqqD) [Georgenia satyanarayanai]SSA40079.1 Coenzyme PQQ synthesis protein D (PqqD) [Georgenia satyanarayanai]
MQLRSEDITWQEIDGELVILDTARSVYLTTNVAGAHLAKLLTEDRSLEELTDALTAEYDIDRPTAEQDAAAFVADLRTKGLLR